MKNMRLGAWVALAMFVLSVLPAVADFGTITRHGCTGAQGSWSYRAGGETYQYLKVDVPAGAAKMTVETGTDSPASYGNCSLYVRYGTLPSATSPNTKVSLFPGFKQRAELANPPAGRYYIRLYGQGKYRTNLKVVVMPKAAASLTGTWSGRGTALGQSMNFKLKFSKSGTLVTARGKFSGISLSAKGRLAGNKLLLILTPVNVAGARVTGRITATVKKSSMSGKITVYLKQNGRTRMIPGTFKLKKTGRSLAEEGSGEDLLQFMLEALIQ